MRKQIEHENGNGHSHVKKTGDGRPRKNSKTEKLIKLKIAVGELRDEGYARADVTGARIAHKVNLGSTTSGAEMVRQWLRDCDVEVKIPVWVDSVFTELES